MPPEAAQIDAESTAEPGQRTPAAAKVRLLTLDDLDRRTRAAQRVHETRQEVISDLGGEDQLSTLEKAAVDHVSLLDTMVKDAGARWLRGEGVEIAAIATLVNAFNRSASVLGWQRRSRDVTPSLGEYMRTKAAEKAKAGQ